MTGIDTLIGEIECVTDDRLSGWAMLRQPDGRERPAMLELFVDDALLFRFAPNHFRPDVAARGGSGIADIGFRLDHALPRGTRIALRSVETGVMLGGVHRFVPAARPLRMGIVAPARNEGRFLLEWIAHHRLCGFERFYIADNGGEDDTTDLLTRLDRAGIVRRYDYVGTRHFQLAFYADVCASAEVAAACDVIAVVDCDEFITPTTGRGVPEILGELFAAADVGAVAVNWANYGTSGHLDHDDARLVMEQYTHRAAQDYAVNRHAKAVFRPGRFAGIGNPHAVDLTHGIYRTGSGEVAAWENGLVLRGITVGVDWANLRINHFSTKSRNEFFRRKRSGRADIPYGEEDRRTEGFFALHDTNTVLDPVPAATVAGVRDEIARLRRLIGLDGAPAAGA